MPSQEEMIQSGVMPGSDAPVDPEVPAFIEPTVELTEQERQEFEAEVFYDWDHLQSSTLRAKRAASQGYAEALDRCSMDDYPGCKLVASLNEAGGYVFTLKDGAEIVEPVIAPSPEVVQPPPAPVAAPSAPPAVEVVDPNDPYVKTSDGWECVIDPGDGGGTEVFKGRTKTELSRKLVKAKFNATRELRRRNREQTVINDFDVSTVAFDRVAPIVVQPITPDERFTLTNQLQDPATNAKAFKRMLAAEVADPTSDIGARIRNADNIVAYEASKDIAKRWVARNQDFYNDPSGENIQSIYRFFVKHTLEVTDKNLDTVFNILRTRGALLEVPVEDVEPEVPATPAPVVPASVVPAPAASVVVAPPAKSPVAAPAPKPTQRMRPGSVTTGMSPRQASVRPGATAATPVGLTVEEYHLIPGSVIRKRYATDLVFRQGVDKLIAEGKI